METIKIDVKVIPNAKVNKIVQEEGVYKIHLTAPAVDGKANKALLSILAAHFGVRKRNVQILKGEKSRIKLIEIEV